jgi:hypothetical protein
MGQDPWGSADEVGYHYLTASLQLRRKTPGKTALVPGMSPTSAYAP